MKKLTKRSTKVSLKVAMSILVALVLAMSGVGIYFAFRKPEAPTPEIKVNPLEFSVDAWDGSSQSEDQFVKNFGGRGDNTITIDSAKSFVYFVNQVNSGKTFEGKTIFLNSSIDLKGHSIDPIGKGVNKFKGTFNGGYYTIMNANINGSGLFENVENATIKNLGVYNVNINSVDVAGGLVGKATDTKIENVFVRLGSINGALVGGLVGEFVSSTGEHSISNSFADTTMVGLTVGGLIGKLITINPITISYSYYASGDMAVATYSGEGEYIDYVTEDKVELATAETDFASLDWGYTSEYKETSIWCDYAFAEDSTELSFNYPILAKFVRVYLQGSVYEGVLVDGSGNAIDDVETLEDAVDKINLGGIERAEINIIVEKVFADEIKFESESTVTVKPAKNTTIVRANSNELSIFATTAESKATLILGEKAEENETVPTMVIDGNRSYVEANQLDSGAAVSVLGADFEMHKNVIVQNNINNTTNYGGGVFTAVDAENINLDGTVTACTSGLYGGGVCVLGKATLSMEVFGCVSENGGGAAAVAEIEDADSAEQIASLYGSKHTIQPLSGQISGGGSSFDLNNNRIYMNHATSNGGGVYAGYVWFVPGGVCQIHHNSAKSYGGGLYVINDLKMQEYGGAPAFSSGFVNISYNRLYASSGNNGGAGVFANSAYLNDTVLMRGNMILDSSWWTYTVDAATDATSLNGYQTSNEEPRLLRIGVGDPDLYSTSSGVVNMDEYYDKTPEIDREFEKTGVNQYFEVKPTQFKNFSTGRSVLCDSSNFSAFNHNGAAIRVRGSLTTYASIWSHTLFSPGSLIYQENKGGMVLIAGDVKTNYANWALDYKTSQYSYLLNVNGLTLADVVNHQVSINIHSSVTGLVARLPSSKDMVNYNIRMVNAPDVTVSDGYTSLTIEEGDVYGDISGVGRLTISGGRIRQLISAHNTDLIGHRSHVFMLGNTVRTDEMSIVIGGSSKSDMPAFGVAFNAYRGGVAYCHFKYCQVGVADVVNSVPTTGIVDTNYIYPTSSSVTYCLFDYCRIGVAGGYVNNSRINNKYDTVTKSLNDSYAVWASDGLVATTVCGYSSVYGGIADSDITFSECEFINNTKIIDLRTNSFDVTVHFNGGRYNSNGTDLITKDTTTSVLNTAPAIVSVRNYTVSSGTFMNNVGPMFYHYGNASITGGTFEAYRSGVLVPEGTLWISGGVFGNNSNFNGGVAQIPYGATVNIAFAEDGSQPVFTNNTATEYGGVFDVQGTLNVYAGEFTGNSAGLGGAAISQADYSTLYLNNGTFKNNSSPYGTILAKNMGMYGQTDKNSILFENNTSDYGTVVFAGMFFGGNNDYSNDFVLENVTFKNNVSTYLNQAPIYLFDVTPNFKIGVGVAIENTNENTTDIYMDDLNNGSYTQYITAMGSNFYQSYKVYKAGLQQYLGSINDRNTVVYFGNGFGTANSFPVQIVNDGLSATYMEDRVVATGKSALPSYSYARDNYNFVGYSSSSISSYDPIKINGNSDEMTFTGAESVKVGDSNTYYYCDKFTISLWAYMDNWAEYADDSQRIISNNYADTGWALASINGYVGLDFAMYEDIVSPTIHWSHLTDGWHRFMVVFDGSNFYLYVDGVLIGHTIATEPYFYYSTAYYLGCEAEVNGKFFHGKVKQLYILNEVLQPEDTYVYDNLATQGYTKVGEYSNTITDNNGYGVETYLSCPMDLGGSYEYADKMTMSVWAYMDDWRWYATDSRRLIACNDVWSISANQAGYFRFDAYDAGSEQWRSIDTTIRCMDLTSGWHNFVMVFNGKTVTAYIDGIRIGISSTFTGQLGGHHYTGANIIVGAMGDSGYYWNEFGGKIKNLYILNEALSEEELFGTRQHYGTKLYTTTSVSSDYALNYSQWNKAIYIYTHYNCSCNMNYGYVDHSKEPEFCLFASPSIYSSTPVGPTGIVTSITSDSLVLPDEGYVYRLGNNTYPVSNYSKITLSSSNVTLYANNYLSLYRIDTIAPTISNFTITETPLTPEQIRNGIWGSAEYFLSWDRDDWCTQTVEVHNPNGDIIYQSAVNPDDTAFIFYGGQLYDKLLGSQYFGAFNVKLTLTDGSGNSSYATVNCIPKVTLAIEFVNFDGYQEIADAYEKIYDAYTRISLSEIDSEIATKLPITGLSGTITYETYDGNTISSRDANSTLYLDRPTLLRIIYNEPTNVAPTEYTISYTYCWYSNDGPSSPIIEDGFSLLPSTYTDEDVADGDMILSKSILKPGYILRELSVTNGTDYGGFYEGEFAIPQGFSGDISVSLCCQLEFYVVTYNANGGTLAEDYNASYGWNQAFTVEGEEEYNNDTGSYYYIPYARTGYTATRPGYKFLGWSTLQEGGAISKDIYIPVGTTGNITYYAQWAKEYTITYQMSSDGTYEGSSTYVQTFFEGESVKLITPAITNEWATEFFWVTEDYRDPATGDYRNFYFGETVKYTQNVTFYLSCGGFKNAYSYYYNGDEQIYQGNIYESTFVYAGDTPTKEGCTFKGWNYDLGNGDYAFYTQSALSRFDWEYGNDYYFYAVFDENLYEITYEYTNAHTTYSQNPIAINHNPTTYDGRTAITIADPILKEGYSISGYMPDSKMDGMTIKAGTTGNLTIGWEIDINGYSVTYNANGGTLNGSYNGSYTVEGRWTDESEMESDYGVPYTSTGYTATREGYTFLGWARHYGETPVKDITIPVGTTGDITFYAMWEEEAPKTYTIKYNLRLMAEHNGSTLSYTETFTEGESFRLITPYLSGILGIIPVTNAKWSEDCEDPNATTYEFNQLVTFFEDKELDLIADPDVNVTVNYYSCLGDENTPPTLLESHVINEDNLEDYLEGTNQTPLKYVGTAPTKANNGRIGYEFYGWMYEICDLEGNQLNFGMWPELTAEYFVFDNYQAVYNFHAVYAQHYINTLFVVGTAEGGTTNVTGQFTVDSLDVTMNVDDNVIEVGDKEIVATANDSTVFLYWSIRTDHTTETVYITPVFAGEDEVEEVNIVKVNALNKVSVDLYAYNADTTTYEFVQSFVVPEGEESGSFKVLKTGDYKLKYSASLSYVSSTETHQILNLYDGSSKIATTSSAHNTQYLSELKNMSSNVITFKFFNAYALNKNEVSIANVVEGLSIQTANNDTLEKTEDINIVLNVNNVYVIKEGTVYSIKVSTSTLTGVTKSYSYLGYDYTLHGVGNGSASYNGGVTSYIEYKGFVVNPGVTANANDVGATGTYTYEIKATAKLTKFVIKLVENVEVEIDVDTIVETETTNNANYQVTLTSSDNLIKTFTTSTIQDNGLTLYKSTWSVVVSGGTVNVADVRSWFTTSSAYTITVQEGSSANTFVVIIA